MIDFLIVVQNTDQNTVSQPNHEELLPQFTDVYKIQTVLGQILFCTEELLNRYCQVLSVFGITISFWISLGVVNISRSSLHVVFIKLDYEAHQVSKNPVLDE